MIDESQKSFTFLVTKLTARYRNELSRSFASHGFSDITPDYWIVLESLLGDDNISINELSKRTNKDAASISRILDGMERNDLVNRALNDNDKRSYRIVLTKYAKSIMEKLKGIEQTVLEKSTIGLNPIEVKELIRMINHVFDKLD